MENAKHSGKTLTNAELRRVVNAASRARFGVAASKLTTRTTSESSKKGAEARRLAFAARYAHR